MKIVCYDTGMGPRCGILNDNSVVDAGEVLGLREGLRDAKALLELGDNALDDIRKGLASTKGTDLSKVTLLSPILQPPTIRDFSVYEGHVSMGGKWKPSDVWYRLPTFYFSNPLCVYGPNSILPYPSATQKFDFELELAIVIGREGRNVPAGSAMDHVAGFMIFVDWSSRDVQRDEMQLHLGPAKGKDSGNSFGPWIVTKDELDGNLRNGQLHAKATLQVNGSEWVAGRTEGMQHNWEALIERASRDSRIVPGDIIGAGCIAGGSVPEAVRGGFSARYLEPGDRVEATIEGLGKLVTTIGPSELSAGCYPYLPPTPIPRT